MLEKLISEIRTGGLMEPVTLASRLNTTPGAILAMLEHLERLGLIQQLSNCNGSGCGGCSLAGQGCSSTAHPRIWTLVHPK